jgi:hypothetical protein
MFEPAKKHKTNMAKVTVMLQNLQVGTDIYPDKVMIEAVKKY